MPFVPVSEIEDPTGSGNFPAARRIFFNQCGLFYYRGSLTFRDSRHRIRRIPIFLDECLEEKPQTYALLKQLRRDLKNDRLELSYASFSARSIHQNENGYLPYSDAIPQCSSAVRTTARLFGELPHNQAASEATTHGSFLEYTFKDEMHVECRFIVDYSFNNAIYMTLGHYNEDSFALLIRSEVELNFEVMPTLSHMGVQFSL